MTPLTAERRFRGVGARARMIAGVMLPALNAFGLLIILLTSTATGKRAAGKKPTDSKLCFLGVKADEEANLMVDIFKGYNSLVQPVRNLNDTPIIVRIALQLVLLINVACARQTL